MHITGVPQRRSGQIKHTPTLASLFPLVLMHKYNNFLISSWGIQRELLAANLTGGPANRLIYSFLIAALPLPKLAAFRFPRFSALTANTFEWQYSVALKLSPGLISLQNLRPVWHHLTVKVVVSCFRVSSSAQGSRLSLTHLMHSASVVGLLCKLRVFCLVSAPLGQLFYFLCWNRPGSHCILLSE